VIAAMNTRRLLRYFDHTMVGKIRKWGMAMADSNIHVSEELLAELQKAAAAEQRTADEVAQEAVERYLRPTRREKLYAYAWCALAASRGPARLLPGCRARGPVPRRGSMINAGAPKRQRIILRMPVKRRRALVATNPIKD
jgi:hypothetical protein